MTAGAAATGIKAWVEAHAPALLTSAIAQRTFKLSLLTGWVLVAGLLGAGAT